MKWTTTSTNARIVVIVLLTRAVSALLSTLIGTTLNCIVNARAERLCRQIILSQWQPDGSISERASEMTFNEHAARGDLGYGNHPWDW